MVLILLVHASACGSSTSPDGNTGQVELINGYQLQQPDAGLPALPQGQFDTERAAMVLQQETRKGKDTFMRSSSGAQENSNQVLLNGNSVFDTVWAMYSWNIDTEKTDLLKLVANGPNE